MMKKFFSSLFWKISLTFLLILLVMSIVYIYISVTTAQMYFQETRQKLNNNIARHIVADNQIYMDDTVNTSALKQVFHNVMVINPSIEVYLLNTDGKILAYYAPDQIVKLKRVPLEPINKFIASDDNRFLLGVDPKNPNKQKAFSAARVFYHGEFKGYIYVILGGREYDNASQLLFGSYILRLGIRSMVIALIMAVIIGFIAIGFIIRNLRKIIYVIRDFQSGNLQARVSLGGEGELNEFASSFNEMADTIVRNIDEIKRMDNQRRDLVANVSHDLRTPLSIIRGYVETVLIKEDQLSPVERRKYLETILSGTDRLLNLVEELFELSKLEAKENLPDKESFSLAELLQDIHQKNLIIAETKKIKFNLKLENNTPFITADIGMMEKVFQNLLDNALKFTDAGGEININLKKSVHKIIVEISDTGKGISAEEIPRIFDRYYQIKRVSDGKTDGTGLGLAIVKKIADLHSINIKVISEVNKGTSFILSIPIN
jgi:signal transduction histidine kinase